MIHTNLWLQSADEAARRRARRARLFTRVLEAAAFAALTTATIVLWCL